MKHYYITDETRQGLIDEWMTYFEENGKDIRGHVLIYGDDSRLRSVSMSGTSIDMPEKELFTSGTEEGNAALKEWIGIAIVALVVCCVGVAVLHNRKKRKSDMKS